MKTALIVFVRHPEIGKVKTRLASSMGEEAALAIYQKLLAHTFLLTTSSTADKFIFYTGQVMEQDMWSMAGFSRHQQAAGDLGHRMQHAFDTVFAKGYGRAIIIGSDCYDLSPDIIEQGFQLLEKNDVVIGPAQDGGYYLLGMKKLHPPLFVGKSWSTNSVFAETQITIQQLGLSCGILPVLNDVDEEKDVPLAWLNKT